MKKIFLLIIFSLGFTVSISNLFAQGCVAIRGGAIGGGNMGNGLNLSKGEFNFQSGFRYFKSFRHFRGSHEEANRVAQCTEVINHSYFLDLGLSYGISNRFYANAVLPFVYHLRSSMYEHGGNPPNGLGERHETSSRGLADARIGVGFWLFDPNKHQFNYSIGLGVKLPTGKYDYTDVFYNQGPERNQDLEKVVDQSIQPGDGGTGITLDLQGYHPITHSLGISTSLFYLFNPQATNGVKTRSGTSEFSCPDQFAARIGANYTTMKGLNFFLGGRAEGVPAKDAIGSSEGYRRPGYAVSIEPGVGYFKNKFAVFASAPIAMYRKRTQSFEDKQRTQQTGVYTRGDAAFADYLLNIGVSYRFGKSAHSTMSF